MVLKSPLKGNFEEEDNILCYLFHLKLLCQMKIISYYQVLIGSCPKSPLFHLITPAN